MWTMSGDNENEHRAAAKVDTSITSDEPWALLLCWLSTTRKPHGAKVMSRARLGCRLGRQPAESEPK